MNIIHLLSREMIEKNLTAFVEGDEVKMVLGNLKSLRSEMITNEIAVTVFRFDYKKERYFVSVCLLTDEDRKKKEAEYALVRLCFMRERNLDDYLDCYANSVKITAGMTELRNFLGVEYQSDGRAWLDAFCEYFGQFIPLKIPATNAIEQQVVIRTLCLHEKRDPNRTFRSYMFRNGKENGIQKHRTEYNGQLALFRFPQLYPRFKDDKTISFAFTADPNLEKSEAEILANFEANERKKKG